MLGNPCRENMIVPTPKLASFLTVVVDIVDITYDIVDVCIVVCREAKAQFRAEAVGEPVPAAPVRAQR